MYNYTDLTYPQFTAVIADYSLFYATGLATFRFEFVAAVAPVVSQDVFRFKALYKGRELVAGRDFLLLRGKFPSRDFSVLADSLRTFVFVPSRERVFSFDSARFSLVVGLRDRPQASDVFATTAAFRLRSAVLGGVRVSFKATTPFKSDGLISDVFKIGRGSVWRDRTEFFDSFSTSAVLRFFDRAYLSEYLKVKGERQREDDGVGAFDSFSVTSFARFVGLVSSSDIFVVKNPAPVSFLLGDTSPSDTALGGRLYV